MKNALGIRVILKFMGWVAILLGVGTAIYSVFVLRPKVEKLTDQIEKNVSAVDSVAQVLVKNKVLLASSSEGFESGTQMVALLPQTLTALSGTLLESSELLRSSSQTAKETKEGIAGVVLPKQEMTANVVFLRKTATQLKIMAGMIDKVRASSVALATSASEISAQINQLQSSGSINLPDLLQRTRDQLQEIHQSVRDLSPSNHLALAGMGFGGLYILLGIFSLAFAEVYSSVVESLPANSGLVSTQSSREKQRVA